MFAASFDPAGLQIMAVGVDGKFRSYSCEVCARIPGLLRLAQRRLEATGRASSPRPSSDAISGSRLGEPRLVAPGGIRSALQIMRFRRPRYAPGYVAGEHRWARLWRLRR